MRSIHLPVINFNPLSPCGERRSLGATCDPGEAISIHSPHAGRDCDWRPLDKRQINFNPLSPCGERRSLGATCDPGEAISIHSPHAGRDVTSPGERTITVISIHSPHAGRDATFAVTPVVPPLFQSTLPMRGETEYSGYVFEYNKHFNPLSPCGERLK